MPADHAVDTNVTSDPYSIDIAINGTKSRITDLDSNETKPHGMGRTTLTRARQPQRPQHL